jgi:hypothetical protein
VQFELCNSFGSRHICHSHRLEKPSKMEATNTFPSNSKTI